MRRPGLNENEGIRINIEQRYFLEDRFSKQGKLKVCKEEKIKFLLILYSELCFHLHVTWFISSALSQLMLHCATQARLPLCGLHGPLCLCYYFNSLFMAVV